MDTRGKVLIDRLVAVPLAWGLTLSARALEHVVRRDHSAVPEEIRTIVVAKLLGMGSIIQATPFLSALKQQFPNAKLVFITTQANRPLVQRLPMIDEALYLRDQEPHTLCLDSAATVANLVRRGVDLYFDLEVYSAGASILALTSLARNRYGFYRHSARFKKGNYTHLVFFNVRMPVARLYLQLLQAAGGPETEVGEYGPILLKPEEVSALRKKLSGFGVPEGAPYIVANPNASDLLLERRWPAERFKVAIEKLVQLGNRVVLMGAPNEAAYVESIWSSIDPALRDRVIDTAGRLSLAEVFALIADASCVVTNDTGPMHVAIALRRPTVCLFGPGSPDHYGVHRSDVEILYESVVCSPCIYETDEPPCGGHNVCMQLISADAVVAAVERLLGTAPSRVGSTRHLPLVDEEVHFVDEHGRALGVVVHSSVWPEPV